MRTRKDVWKLSAGDDTLEWYARGIAEMQNRLVTDSTSWRYQAAIHDYDPNDDPLAIPGETLPPQSEQDTFWARCQHGSWFFLPWHRGYLFYFEQILRQFITQAKGPSDWALPYWNYSDPSNPKARSLPPAFQAATFAGLTPNPLLVTQRANGANTGQPLGTPASAENSSCLKKPGFINSSAGGGTGFGGGRTGFSHNGSVPGECERVPHGTMHGAVGGPTGWMSAFNTAGLDPIFWLHHSNIDRLWEVWRRRDPNHTDPTVAAWLSAISFDFHDATGTPVSITASQVVDTTTPLLDYVYEDVSDPLPPPAPVAGMAATTVRSAMEIEKIPEMVGATDAKEGISLGGEPRSIQFALQAPSGPTARGFAPAAPKEVHLNLENITATRRPIESYLVYVNLPEGEKPDKHPELMAGLLPMFGIVEASRRTKSHAGDGVGYSFDITHIVSLLQERKAWNPATIRVTFVPHRGEAERAIAPAATLPIKVGRVSVYVA
jgi:tyrosinase